MNQPEHVAVEQAVIRAITADEQANALYYQTIKRFISSNSVKPEARLDAIGLKKLDAAWIKINSTSKNLRKAYMKLYSTSV
jgi:hypothetical protein